MKKKNLSLCNPVKVIDAIEEIIEPFRKEFNALLGSVSCGFSRQHIGETFIEATKSVIWDEFINFKPKKKRRK